MDNLQLEEITEIVKQYSLRINDSSIFFAPNIPPKKLKNAIQTYAPIEAKEQPLVLINNTLFGGAKKGALITDKWVYSHNLFEKPQKLELDEIRSISFSYDSASSGKILVNGIQLIDAQYPQTVAMEQIYRMLQEIAISLNPDKTENVPLKKNLTSDSVQPAKYNDKQPLIQWRTVRVFVSSTFRDMQAERDFLAKVVFPELRERMVKRHLHLVDLDLRWGVTEEEAEGGKVLEVILQEIDRSRPFFVGLLGERYGSLPDKVPEDTQRAFPWLQEYAGCSLTSLEIVHGVLRKPELAKHSFFYFRDPQIINYIPQNKRVDFSAESPEAACKVAALKEKIRSAGVSLTESYPCCWDEQDGRVAGLETFGQKVLEDLWAAICEEYPAEAPDVDPVVVERQLHEAFVEERSYLHVGRVEQAERLTRFVQGDNPRPVVVTGESGCGKSAFLAKWYRQYAAEHPDDFVLAYFVGASPDSTSHYRLLRNMCNELKRKFALDKEVPQENEDLSEVFGQILTAIAITGSSSVWQRLSGKPTKQAQVKRVIVLLDALDQLLPLEAAHGLGWLLDYVPPNVCLVTSSLEGDCLDVLRRHGAEEIMLPPLSFNEQQQIINALLGTWGRKLDNRQTTALLTHPETKNPLYLRVALEELRLFGKFEQLTQRIDGLAPNIIELFGQVLARLEEDHGREFVGEAFALVGCSRFGLSEIELLDLLSSQKAGRLPRVLWTRLMFGTKMYLVQRGELFGFFHRQLADAVKTRYPPERNVHVELAKYFEHSPIERKIDEFPFQLQHAEQWQTLAGALSDLDLFDYAWDHNREYEWVGYWLSLKECFQADHYYRIALEARIKAEGENKNVASLSNRISLFLADMAFYNSAKPFCERALKIWENASQPNDPDVAQGLNNLALLYSDQGRYAEALPLYQRALKIKESALGPNHPGVALSLCNLAGLYSDQGRYAEALPLYQRALKIRESTLGPNHPDVAVDLYGIAKLYNDQGKYDQALPFYQRALKIWENSLGPNHPHVASSLNGLAVLYHNQGRYDEALPLYKRALKIYEGALGPNHPKTRLSRENLKRCRDKMR